jgi:ubiquinone/menaquinone biosynthesis C-methylase UbiE
MYWGYNIFHEGLRASSEHSFIISTISIESAGDTTMDRLELHTISERYSDMINPITRKDMIFLGEVLNLNGESRVIDFGAGFGEMLLLWAENYGASGFGIEYRNAACKEAWERIHEGGFEDSIEIVEGDASEVEFEKNRYDVACCIGASFIWGGFRNTIIALKEAIQSEGQIVIAEPHWREMNVPDEIREKERDAVFTESELVGIAREEGFEVKYIQWASLEGWSQYVTGHWRSLVEWIKENPDHEDLQQVTEHLHTTQDEYLTHIRKYVGLVTIVLTRI